MKVKESVLASVLSAIFTVFLVFSLLIASNAWYIKTMFLNPNKFIKTMDFPSIAMEIEEDLLEGIPSENERMIYKGVFESDFFTIVLTEFYEAALYGDATIDHDKIKKELEPVVEEFIEENDFEDEIGDMDEELDELLYNLEEELGEIAYSNDMVELQKFVKTTNQKVDIVLYSSIIASVIMLGILFIVYINKYRPVFFGGLALTISQGLNLLGALSAYGIINYALSSAMNQMGMSTSEDLTYLKIFSNICSGFLKEAMLLFGLLLIIGIGGIVAGNILSKNFEAVEDIE